MSSEDRRDSKAGEMFSKMFHRKSHVGVVEVSDTASVTSNTPLVHPKASTKPKDNLVTAMTQQAQLTSTEERDMYDDLMKKSKTLSPEEFKVYLRQHKETYEALQRKNGAGITGLGWIYKDNTRKLAICMSDAGGRLMRLTCLSTVLGPL